MSTDKNSFLSYLARIHCSRRSLHVEHSVFTYCMLALITGTHTQISLGSSAHLLHVFALCSRRRSLRHLAFAKTKRGARNPKGKCLCTRVPIPSGTQLTFHQDFVSCRPNGRSPEKPEPLHTRWLCCLLCARWRPCRSSLHLTASCFIITEKLSRRPQTELLLPVLKPQEVAILIRGTVWAFLVVVFFT